MSELIFDGPWPGSVDDRVQELWRQISLEYDTQGSSSRLNCLTLTMFYHGSSSQSCFTGKAAEALALLPVLRAVCAEWSDGSNRDMS